MTTTKKISELPDSGTLQGDEIVPLVQGGATRKTSVSDIRQGLSSDDHSHTLADISDAGSAAGADVEDFATAEQGAKADTALQPDDVGTAALADTGDFATAEQGGKADTAVQPGDLSAIATSGNYTDISNAPYPGLINAVINGGCLISHRGTKDLTDDWQYGPVDLLAVKAEGVVTNGEIRQVTTAFSLAQTGGACWVWQATLDEDGAILFRHRIEAKSAWAFLEKAAYFSARTYHDAGQTLDYDIMIRAADAFDDFSSVTEIESDTIQIGNDDNTSIALVIADMGDCRNGIEIEVRIDCGAVTDKNFYLAQMQLSIGADPKPFELRPAALEEGLVHRYLRPLSGMIAIANSASNMQAVLDHPGMRAAPTYEVTAPLDFTDGYTADYSQSAPHIDIIHENTRHHGRADIALFSGLTSGRVHIQRGTSGIVLASAEL